MHIKRFDRSCIKICIRRHAFHQTEWTDVANWVKVCPSGCRFRLFFANAHRLRLSRPELAKSSLLQNTRKRTTAQTGRWMSRRKANRGPQRGLLPELGIPTFLAPIQIPSICSCFFFFLLFLFFFYTLIIILVKSKVHHKQLSHWASSTIPHSYIYIFF